MENLSQESGATVSGFPSPAEQYVEPPLDINAYLVQRPAATFFMRVEGDAMQEAAILDQDVVVVDFGKVTGFVRKIDRP